MVRGLQTSSWRQSPGLFGKFRFSSANKNFQCWVGDWGLAKNHLALPQPPTPGPVAKQWPSRCLYNPSLLLHRPAVCSLGTNVPEDPKRLGDLLMPCCSPESSVSSV